MIFNRDTRSAVRPGDCSAVYIGIAVIERGRMVNGLERSDEGLVTDRRGEGTWRRVSEEYEGG